MAIFWFSFYTVIGIAFFWNDDLVRDFKDIGNWVSKLPRDGDDGDSAI